jgi:thiol:disulfide interchange protein DsbA
MAPTRSLFLLAMLLTTLAVSASAAAQLAPGRDYQLVDPPQPTAAGKNVEVIEFFWYGCPHCSNMQASLRAWLKKKPADVDFKRMPAAFEESWLQLARTYYTLEAMGLVEKLHHDVFAAIHGQRVLDPKLLLRDPKPLFDWVAGKAVDRQKFIDTYNSFGVNSRTQRTMDVTHRYDVPFTPVIIVDGKYITAPSMSPDKRVDYERYFKVLDEVIAMARKARAGK